MSSGLPSPPSETNLTNLVNQTSYFENDGSNSIYSTGHEKILSSEALDLITPPEELSHDPLSRTPAASLIEHAPRPTLKDILSQSLNPTNSMFNSTPFLPSSKGPCFATFDQSFWYWKTSPLLTSLLSAAQYPEQLQNQYLSFFHHSIIPALGPGPSAWQNWTPNLTHNNSPFEPSWNLQGDKRQVRFTFEPIGPYAGTRTDPTNQILPLAFVGCLAGENICPRLNLDWWHHFTEEFFVSPSDSDIATTTILLPDGKVPPTCFLAFDLPSTEFAPVVKPYLFPHRRALLERKSTKEVMFDAVKKLHSPTSSILLALSMIENFLSSRGDDIFPRSGLQQSRNSPGIGSTSKGMSVEMLTFDCIEPSQARIKIFAKTHNTSFANVREIYTLGGRLRSPEIAEGGKVLKDFWRCLFGLSENWDEKEMQLVGFLFFGFEIQPGKEYPEVKVYVPSWTCDIGDVEIGRSLDKFVSERDQTIGKSYCANLQGILSVSSFLGGQGATHC
jgi:DMATS type aromatic prenyltransferase